MLVVVVVVLVVLLMLIVVEVVVVVLYWCGWKAVFPTSHGYAEKQGITMGQYIRICTNNRITTKVI